MAKMKDTVTTAVVAKSNNLTLEIAKRDIQHVNIESLIIMLRGQQTLLDRDLAMLYGVETRRLNEQVQRNIERFPEDFMFQLTKEEFENLKSQIATSKFQSSDDKSNLKSQIATSNWGGTRKRPYAFTRNGIAMLSSVLRSQTAVDVNISIMRAFTATQQFFAANAQMFQRIEVIEHNQLALAAHQQDTDKKVEQIFNRLDDRSKTPTQGIFYDGQIFDAYTFVSDIIRSAKKSIVLFDNYVDDTVLTMLDKRKPQVAVSIYTKSISKQLSLDLAKHNSQYQPIEVKEFGKVHDRFLCIDNTVYHIGASLKDLGKKWFAFTKMEMPMEELIGKM